MAKYVGVYKCELCEEFEIGEGYVEADQEFAMKMTGDVIRKQIFSGNPYLNQVPLHTIHRCKDGSAGLAIFAGFKRME